MPAALEFIKKIVTDEIDNDDSLLDLLQDFLTYMERNWIGTGDHFLVLVVTYLALIIMTSVNKFTYSFLNAE